MDKFIEIFIEIIGWTGSLEVILAYALVSNNKISSTSPAYQWLNLTGGVFLIIHTIVHESYPSTFINIVWVIIAVIALWNIRKERNKQRAAGIIK
ncbi:MAG: hypothetical protein WBA74_13970 [Cyclobacteriaceae bacterium]